MSSSFLHWSLQLLWHSSSQESFAGFIAFIIAGAPKAISFVIFSLVALFSAPKSAKRQASKKNFLFFIFFVGFLGNLLLKTLKQF